MVAEAPIIETTGAADIVDPVADIQDPAQPDIQNPVMPELVPTAPKRLSTFCAKDHARIVHTEPVCPACVLLAVSRDLMEARNAVQAQLASAMAFIELLQHKLLSLQAAAL